MAGESFPAGLVVQDVQGELLQLDALLQEAPTLLVLYRGGWCPHCMRHLSGLQLIEDDMRELGVRMVALSPDRPEAVASTVEAYDGGMRLLSDPGLEVAQALGLAFRLDEDTRERYRGYNIELTALTGEGDALLPVPAAILVDRDRQVRFVYANPDYRQRVDPQLLLQAARGLVGAE